MKLGVY